MARLPKPVRRSFYRKAVRLDPRLPDEYVFKLAETREELEACFRLLHDAYVDAGFMVPDPSGLRVTLYHALPTTSTLLAAYRGEVIGTLSLIRESVLGFPMQKVFTIDEIRQTGGRVAEVSALAVDRRFRSASGRIVFPLMKFMYEYAIKHFDTRHLVIAVNPGHIEFYENILCFKRIGQLPVAHYDFVNGAPAVGAHLDLVRAEIMFRKIYGNYPSDRNLHGYFTGMELPNIVFPEKRFHTTNNPVMTPMLIDYFFNQRTQEFSKLQPQELLLLHRIYDLPAFKACLPPVPEDIARSGMQPPRHLRFSVMCPGAFFMETEGVHERYPVKVIECARGGLRVRTEQPLPTGVAGKAVIELGVSDRCMLSVLVLSRSSRDQRVALLKIVETDAVWNKFVSALEYAQTHDELSKATRFI